MMWNDCTIYTKCGGYVDGLTPPVWAVHNLLRLLIIGFQGPHRGDDIRVRGESPT